ncbi:MAG: glycine--tRNA ligase subunit beta [Alphaproteobacteria bacterium]|nr:glycine--tRNA ligase subunit beta [Alphaproteobacteria bacterium]MBU1525427.1 glycine--tRNA ligase subunit beta [Alphaproteobacteria bacterium]MBU2118118.1 glycine--tRNA ligase subunit beta [Alphaproteobacteria bacterium]MBU2352568.1 glycine--tRNA ligase subunit beta [Alphaproteobacteria bacterium]MBU2381790.1 glycine--tRNA ligase subunit beta [Alphaproteobacteria bacterium]
MPQLLLELFSEEIPARMQAGAARDLERMATERLKAAGLSFDALTTFAGPRRLTLVVDGLPAATPDREEELKGPKATAPEQALEGFLRKTGLTRDQLVERDGVLFAVISSKGRATADLIPAMVDEIVRGFPWPKSMRWGTGTLRWVRPLKRIVCLFDGAVVPFDVDEIASGDVTEGHRFLGSGTPFAVRDFADYRQKLEREFVLLDVADRKLRILEGAKTVCADRGLSLVDDDGLLDEVAGLAEWPTPILGDMDPAFLDLPPEVVRLSMKVHQKYFAVRGPARDGLAPHFVVVANVEASDGGKALAAGNSRVLSARLNDARFFWDEDRKTGFDAWLKKLEGVTFHAKLGTLAERVDRIAALAREIAPRVGADADKAEQAARLAKADLASGMVGEFPELQGVMGGYYARAGHGDAIADAIRDHYRPQGPSDAVPTAPLTVAVALADKLDTLVGFFAIDEKPTGSKDPFALRRAALGVIRLVLENGVRLPLTELIRLWVGREAGQHILDNPELVSAAVDVKIDLPQFFADRLKVLLRDQGQRHDLVDAVFALGDDDLVRIVRRVEALDGFLATDDGANLLAGHRRASNILKAEAKKGEVPVGMVQTGLPNQPPEETALAFAAAAAQTAVDQALEAEDFAAAMRALSGLRAPVDAFFTGVMVNSDVPAERDNRLKLLGQIRAVMGRVADFDRIAG